MTTETKTKAHLSKSDFVKYKLCPSYFWLTKFKPELIPPNEDEAREARMRQGDEVEAVARLQFADDNPVLIKSFGSTAQVKTKQLVESEIKTIFQATAITDNGLLAMADILKYNDETEAWDIYEVKSASKLDESHYIDVTFQRIVFEKAGYNIGKTYLIHLNKEYIRNGEVKASDFLIVSDASEKVKSLISQVELEADEAAIFIETAEEPKSCNCRMFPSSKHCPTFGYFNPDIPEYSVYDLSYIGKSPKKLTALIEKQIFSLTDIPDDFPLTDNQKLQVEVEKRQCPTINNYEIELLLSDLEYPLYFLDYESLSTAIPIVNGARPNQHVVFQYSLHCIQSPGTEPTSTRKLAADTNEHPSLQILKTLDNEIGRTGSVIVWHKGFEVPRNNEMARDFPDFAEMLQNVNSRVFDLEDVFSKKYFIHPKFKGRSSIKVVLPTLLPAFSYKELNIQSGSIAPLRWMDMVTGAVSEEASKEIYEDLLKYCNLDTLAMVKIYDYLRRLPENVR